MPDQANIELKAKHEDFRIAAIDMGTNSFHMVVATVNSKGIMKVIAREKEVVRLGSSSGEMKFIQAEAFKRAIRTLSHFSEIAKTENADIVAVATSAVREAINKEDFIDRVKNKTGIEVHVVSGQEEARLINLGVMNSLNIFDKQTLVIDIGGGSTETILSFKADTIYLNSVKLGAIRLTKKFFDDGDVTEEKITKCVNYIKGEWTPILDKLKEFTFKNVIGTSGTIQTIVSMAILSKKGSLPDSLNGIGVNRNAILEVIEKLKKCRNVAEIESLSGVDSSRADILLGGALIIEYAIKYLGIKRIVLSNYALREGIVFDTYQKVTQLDKYHHLSDLRFHSILNLCEKYESDLKHVEHVKYICTELFNGTKEMHDLGEKELELLESAAYLHDIGFHISHDSHHKHSYYLIKNSVLPGFTNDEQEVIANIARYHRKSHPKKVHENFAHLSENKKNTVWVLAGILRIAEGIDRRQIAAVENISIEIQATEILIKLKEADGKTAEIELWGANRRKEMLEIKLGKKIKFELL